MTSRLAIVLLACRDFAAFELAMAAHASYLERDVPFYIVQNCRGTYDAERTLGVARKYANLFPRTIRVVEDYAPASPYLNIRRLLSSGEFEPFDIICKVDDDAFPISDGWLRDIVSSWAHHEKSGKYAYATPLINNNNWGFTEVLRLMKLESAYLREVARDHVVGADDDRRIIPASQIETGTNGTVWSTPHIARWIHQKTSSRPEDYIAATKNLAPCDIEGAKRYSIGCIVFRKSDWLDLEGESTDDEHLWHMRCQQRNLSILCVRSVPFVHLAYFTQREENRDIVDDLKRIYAMRFNLPFPLSLYQSPDLELHARLRWLEDKISLTSPTTVLPLDKTDNQSMSHGSSTGHKKTFFKRVFDLMACRRNV